MGMSGIRFGCLCVAMVTCLQAQPAFSEASAEKVVRIAQLVIEPTQLEAYHAAVKEEITQSLRSEPGVLAIYSVAEKDHPNRLHFFEIYASDEAYRKHIASAHFKKYVDATASMILSKELLETSPVLLGSKAP